MDKFVNSENDAVATVLDREEVASPLPFPEVAKRDLEAALQLLTERAMYLTGASGAAVILREGEDFLCRASIGNSPHVTGDNAAKSDLIDECLRTLQIVQGCNSSQERGPSSSMVLPFVREDELIGLLELTAERVAFDEQDIAAVSHLSELILTALEQADACKQAMTEIEDVSADPQPVEPVVAVEKEPTQTAEIENAPPIPPEPVALNIGRCNACGFPISPGRSFCLDCEAAGHAAGNIATPAFAALDGTSGETWWQAHSYTVGTMLVALLTVVLLILKLR